MHDMIRSEPIASMVENYQVAKNEMSRAFELMCSAQNRLKPFFGDRFFSVVDRHIDKYSIDDPDKGIENSATSMKKSLWREIANRMQIYSFMTEKRSREFEDSLTSGNLPDFTIENIQNFYDSFAGNIKNLMQETIQEVFEILRPHNSRHKTNTEYEIGKRAILSQYGDMMHYVDSHLETQLTCIDNVFHLLDGKGTAKYPNNLKCLINDAMRERFTNELTTEYFRVKWYRRSGTIHLEFLRLDLLQKLNAAGGGNRLKA